LGRPILTPQAMIAYRKERRLLPMLEAPPGMILCLQRGLPERLRRRHPLRRVGRLMGDLFLLKRPRGWAGVLTNFGIGSPQMASLAEELIAWGARRLVSISMAGGIQPDLAPGAIVVCTEAIRDEGTSYHYLPPSRAVGASPELSQRLVGALEATGVPVVSGATWTTDGAYMETREEMEDYQAAGVRTVEMEAAALFAVGKVRSVQTAAICVVGDRLANGSWELPDDFGPVERALEAAYEASITVLSGSGDAE
jgi:uridine phosphorylase